MRGKRSQAGETGKTEKPLVTTRIFPGKNIYDVLVLVLNMYWSKQNSFYWLKIWVGL
jgi:hypothetical protein